MSADDPKTEPRNPPPSQPQEKPVAPETFPRNDDWGFDTVKRTTLIPPRPFGPGE
jgi:hypothetical protein